MTDQTPPTDRPLTTGDYCTVPKEPTEEMLNEAQEEFPRSARYAFGKIWSAMLRARPPFADYDYGSFEPGADAPKSRPATSEASEVEGVDRVMAVLNHWFDGRMRVDRNSEMVAQLAALASPPVSERERELEGALAPFAEIGQWFFARDLPDETPVVEITGLSGRTFLTRGMFKSAHSALTVQPAGEGK